MDAASFERVYDNFHAFFAASFGRKQWRERSRNYLQGLLVQDGERRNAENLSESVGIPARSMQRFLTEARWSDDAVIGRLQEYLAPRLGHSEAVWVLDGSDFPKQGRKSVGVARQYCGRLRKVVNCQAGIFLAYVSPLGRALVDKRLNLPESWTSDSERCEAARVSEKRQGYRSKSPLAQKMLEQALAGAIRRPGGSRRTMQERTDVIPKEAWREITVAEGSERPRIYPFSAQRVRPTCRRKTGEIHWAIYRRNLEGSEPRYYLSNAPEDTPLGTLAYVGGSRWRIETEFETEKSDVGLDEYETRSWAGWHHHIAMCLLGGAFLLSLQQAWGGKMPRITRPQVYRVVREMLPRERFGLDELLRWLTETQDGNERARRSHAKRRAALRASQSIPP